MGIHQKRLDIRKRLDFLMSQIKNSPVHGLIDQTNIRVHLIFISEVKNRLYYSKGGLELDDIDTLNSIAETYNIERNLYNEQEQTKS